MRLGIFIGARGDAVGLDVLLEQVVQAEKDGFDSFWFPHVPAVGYDALTMISLAGQRTSRIQLGTAIVPAFPYHPMALAQQALTTQAATNGRLNLGLGVSFGQAIEGMMGLPYDSPARRMREYLSVIRPLVNEGRVEFTGEFFNVNAELYVPDSSPFPVLCAATLPLNIRNAAEVADGAITWLSGRKSIKTYLAPRLNAHAQAAGRPQPRLCVSLPLAVADDPVFLRKEAIRHYGRYSYAAQSRKILEIEGASGIEDVVATGNEAQVEKWLRDFADAGATDFLASIFPVGEEIPPQESRAWALLKSLNGKI